jgi:hypothetical protein
LSTARDLINGSLRLIGAIATGETAQASELQDSIYALNNLLDSLSTEDLIIPTIVREEFSWASGTASRTIGPTTGDFATSRPLEILTATIEDQSTTPTLEYPLDILNDDEWAAITSKSLQSTLPTELYYDATSPLGTLYLYPVPSATNNLVLYSKKALTQITNGNTVIAFLPGYERMLRFNLAIELVPEFGKSVSAEIAEIARESKANIKRQNIKPAYMGCDAALLTRKTFNILTGE